MAPNVTVEITEDLMAQWNGPVWKHSEMLLLEDHQCFYLYGYFAEFYDVFLSIGEKGRKMMKLSFADIANRLMQLMGN